MNKRAAIAVLRDELHLDVEEVDGVVRTLAEDARVVEWSASNGHDHWRVITGGVNAPPRLLYPTADAVPNPRLRTVLDDLVKQFRPHEVETVSGTLVVTFLDDGFPAKRWHACKRAVGVLADAVRGATSALVACPSCGAALVDRAGQAVCAKCNGTLVSGDVARERIFDPRNIHPGALKDASVSRSVVGACPACTHAMAPVLVDDVVIDVCRGCGAVWCDAGEHARLMGGA